MTVSTFGLGRSDSFFCVPENVMKCTWICYAVWVTPRTHRIPHFYVDSSNVQLINRCEECPCHRACIYYSLLFLAALGGPCWVQLFLVSRDCLQSCWAVGFSLWWLLSLWFTGSRAHWLSFSWHVESTGPEIEPLHWQADSLTTDQHQRSPVVFLNDIFFISSNHFFG